MKILLISFECREKDGRLNELIRVCDLIAETAVISRAESKAGTAGKNNFLYVNHKRINYLRFLLYCIKVARSLGNTNLLFADNRAAILPAMICKILLRAKFMVYDARELYILNEVHHFRGKVGCLIENIWIRKFDIITCANGFRAEAMKKIFRLENAPIVFENIRRLVSEDACISDGRTDAFATRTTVNIISTSGCLLERKCDVLAQAVCRLGERYRLFLVGYPEEKGRKTVNLIQKAYKTNNIICVDWLAKPELKQLIQSCDIGVVSYGEFDTNTKYCASGKIYEYLYEGLPVVTTSNPPLKNMCDRFGIGVADDTFLDGIQTISQHLTLYKENVKKYISTIDVDACNRKLAEDICLRLGISRNKTNEMDSACTDASILVSSDDREIKSEYAKILFITGGYPSTGKPLYTFLDALVCTMADCGKHCTVLYPVSCTHFWFHKEKLPPVEWKRMTGSGCCIQVVCPRIVTFSSGKMLRRLRNHLNYQLFRVAVNSTIRKKKLSFDMVYGHFLQPSGFVAAEVGNRCSVPSCVAYGENTDYNVKVFGLKKSRKMIEGITACVSVSSDNTRYLTQNELIPREKIVTIPNAINRKVFYPRDKRQMRRKYGIPQDGFVVAFVGYFTDIKGSQRLSTALDRIQNVHSVFIGSGPRRPTCRNIDFIGSLPHEEIPELLSASDIFVLPTIAEGCCNAIVEALSCGLPVISSNMPFNDDILNTACAIRIDTTDIGAIAAAICMLRDDEERRFKMSREALEKAETLDIQTRADRILHWISHCERNTGRE